MLLWDGEQIDAYAAGRPMPPLPVQDSPDNLLDRNESADLAGVEPRTWDRYANLPGMQPRPDPVVVASIEHWRRGDVLEWLAARPGPGSSSGRPVGSRDTVPRASTPVRAAELLEHEPAITAAQAAAKFGVTADTAQRALSQARAAAVSRLPQVEPDLTADDVHSRLGFPVWAAERALNAARMPSDTDTGKAPGPETS
ncbi:hypothetical protein AB5J56_01815 [Streptomyces sp. R21]|uniref:Sigma-70, region 4 n=1 Tax=Streptomyces sp. R21 TaxID=3238627 RepID=A0AB39NXU3_9ACTN